MTLEVLHRSCGEPPRVPELEETYAGDDVALATQAKRAEIVPDQRRFQRTEGHACDPSPNRRIPLIPTVDEMGKENLLVSFDALAACLKARFDELAADVEHMREGLRAAEARAERLRHELLDNGTLRGWTRGRPVASAS